MRVATFKTDKNHWSTSWVPISYKKKGYTFLWSDEYEVLAICRCYLINKNRIEIGDVWLNEKYRGKKINNKKVSYLFMRRVIQKIWKLYPSVNILTLIVHKNNIPAIKLYKKLRFKNKKINKKTIMMIRYKL
jgi:ribosomal protein S18 acetylase RimI-like enzyme